ncbi:N-lysine methyltransferase setd6 [Phoenix dactylifera]|uniref:N-lysine methyltransferase n=1 Tax=Phoenix dactylifera TaxID=42345 RepID=A0A8B7CND7_PHODC|nr:N-lysine methyltransferase setd6 [Phoenix dactylifera]
MTRRLRAFKRWMRSQGIDWSDALELADSAVEGVSVRALCDLREGDLVSTIPKLACLTIRTSRSRDMIEGAGLVGFLGLTVALMYERSLGPESPWDGYLQLLPERECVPLVWSLEEVDSLLVGTELHKIVKQDKCFLYEDWKESIEPLILSGPLKLDLDSFGVEQYFSAKSLVSSRSFEIDGYHGFGMVPLADLFNHKTGAENVHFTCISAPSGSDDESNGGTCDASADDKSSDVDLSTRSSGEDPTVLEIIIVRDVEAGSEVFNTYGSMGNAALLHRYGFTEPDNPYDIVNIDLGLVIKWCAACFSNRYARSRLSLWRQLKYSGCTSQNSEYFEISFNGEPQLELLVLLYIIFLAEDAYEKLRYLIDSFEGADESSNITNLIKITKSKCSKTPGNNLCHEAPEDVKELMLTENVCSALVSLADLRESLYGSNSLEDDKNRLRSCCHTKERKLYHSLVLRVSERTILVRLRAYASRYSKRKKRKLKEPKS